MPAPKGNEYWKLADWGNPKKYQPQGLWESSCDYFKWALENPWHKNEAIKGGDAAGTIVSIPIPRPFTLHGLCIYLGIVTETFRDYEKQEAFSSVCKRIREIIYNNKFEGAAVGTYNHAIIARDLGLADKKDIDLSAKVDFRDAE